MTKTKKFRENNPKQIMLLPPSLSDWLPANHPSYFVSEVVEGFDLSGIYGRYTELRGYPPYEPRMMVKVWLYGYMMGVRSSRKLERALHEDIGFRVLSGNQQPDHWTLSDFRRRHHQALGDLFEQTVKAAAEAGLVKLKHVAVDGTKVKANASKHRAMSYERMLAEEKRVREEIDRWLEEVEVNDRAEDDLYGKESGWKLPPELATPEKRREFIAKWRKELEARARTEAEKAAKPAPKAQINFTDPESRIMKNADKAFIQGYNAQVAVDAETHIIVAADLTNQAADSPHLPAMVEQILTNTGRRPEELSADAGYFSEANLKALSESGIEPFIPPEKVRHSEWRNQTSPRGRIPGNASPRYLMSRKLRTKRGRKRYRLRQTSVEPVFGHIKEAMGFRQLPLRGLDKARSTWRFQCAAFNLMKLYRVRRAGIALTPNLA